MLANHRSAPRVVAVSVSPGGIPKLPQSSAWASRDGLVGDGRNHAKHIRPDRAVSVWDSEILQQLVAEGFPLTPGAAGENLTVVGLKVQQLTPGTLLLIGGAILKLEQPRKPCYVLDAIDPRLKEVIVGRCGYMASVVREGIIAPAMAITVASEAPAFVPLVPSPDTPLAAASLVTT
ncbi:MAG TPA: MOSC domain-containing protein [Pirellulaceae bacterium]|nr:MOSC domain-containing protein [Pirellulaceae bacterium]